MSERSVSQHPRTGCRSSEDSEAASCPAGHMMHDMHASILELGVASLLKIHVDHAAQCQLVFRSLTSVDTFTSKFKL